MALNVAASLPSSSRRPTSTRLPGSPVSETSSATRASLETGESPVFATAQPSRVATATPIALSVARVSPTRATSASVLVSGSATWMARPGASWVVSTMALVPAMLVMASKGCAWPAATSIAASLGVSSPGPAAGSGRRRPR